MEGENLVILVGNVGMKPEFHHRENADVLRFTMATTNRYKNRSGEWMEQTEWHRLVAFGGRARGLNKILRKGSKAYVKGTLKTSSWEADDGSKRYSTDVIVRMLIPLTPKGSNNNQRDDRGGYDDYGGGGGSSSGYDGDPGFDDDSIPF